MLSLLGISAGGLTACLAVFQRADEYRDLHAGRQTIDGI